MSITYSALEDLRNLIHQEVPSCSLNQVTLNLSRAVREFLIRTKIWEKVFTVDIISGVTEYHVDVDADIYIDTINDAEIDGVSYLSDVELSGECDVTISDDFSKVHDNEVLILKVVAIPYSIPCEIPSRIINRYSEFFIAGALSYLYSSTNKPYSNPQKAVDKLYIYKQGLRRASRDAEVKNCSWVTWRHFYSIPKYR